MRNSRVLIAGLSGLGVEVAKNIVLSGVKSVTLLDDKDVTLSDLTAQFYLGEENIGQNVRRIVERDQLLLFLVIYIDFFLFHFFCFTFFYSNYYVLIYILFFDQRATASLPKVQALNPMVLVSADTEPIQSKTAEFFIQFDLVCLVGLQHSYQTTVN